MGQTLARDVRLGQSLYDQKAADRLKPEMTPDQKLAVQDQALAEAADTVDRLVGKAKGFDPMSGRYYKLEKAAQLMVQADRLLNGGANEAAIAKAFEDRGC